MNVTWHSFDLKSGRRGPQLTTRTLGVLPRIIGESTEAQLEVRCWDGGEAVPGWDAATLPGRVVLVALNEDEQPIWGAAVLRRRDTGSEWVAVDCATLEHYFDRRFVKDHGWLQTDQATIAAGLIGDAVADSGVPFVIDAPLSGTQRDRTYTKDDDRTVLSALQDLMGVVGGPEFTVDLVWADANHMRLTWVARVRDRIGTPVAVPVEFVTPGPVTTYEFVEDYTTENGANDVVAVSSGEGEERPTSDAQVDAELLAAGWVRYEHRYTPSTSITNVSTLNAHARESLAEMRLGLTQLTFESHLDEGPQVEVDFHLGDDLTAVITSPRFPAQVGADGELLPGYSHRMRLVGWEADLDARRFKPTLWEVDD